MGEVQQQQEDCDGQARDDPKRDRRTIEYRPEKRQGGTYIAMPTIRPP